MGNVGSAGVVVTIDAMAILMMTAMAQEVSAVWRAQSVDLAGTSRNALSTSPACTLPHVALCYPVATQEPLPIFA